MSNGLFGQDHWAIFLQISERDWFIYLGFNVAFNTVQIISQLVV